MYHTKNAMSRDLLQKVHLGAICNIMNSRNIQVKNDIANAFIELLKTGEFDKISVVDIISKAQVARNSFYRNFNNKDDILCYYIGKETDEWLSQTEENYLTLTKDGLKEYIVFLFTHLYEYRDIVEILTRNGKIYLLEKEFDKRFFMRLSETYSPWEIAYKAGGVYKLFRYWAETGYEKTPREIAEYIK